jgi:hypothetical protein
MDEALRGPSHSDERKTRFHLVSGPYLPWLEDATQLLPQGMQELPGIALQDLTPS